MPQQYKLILKYADEPGYTPDIDCYLRNGGYEALKKALAIQPKDLPDGKKMSGPEQIRDDVKTSGLRGRGGAGFSCGLKWSFVDRRSGKPIYLICNADESEPGTFKDRQIIHKDPHQLVEGMAISCFANDVHLAYIYIRGEMPHAAKLLVKAIVEARAKGFLGKNICGSGYDLEIHVHRGAGAYICGEETGLIESLEGKRAWPRIKPPYPAIEGLFRKPTIVNNVETLCCVTHILARGVGWFKSIGIPPDPNNKRDQGSYGPKLYCISGHVNKPCCVELPLGVSTRELIDVHGGGVWKGRKAKAVVPGGISMGFLSADELDTKLDFEGPGKVGCLGLGTAALVVVDDQTSMVDVLYNCCRFMSHESCGQCTPCREGTSWMTKILERIRAGRGKMEDIDLLLEVAGSMGIIPGTTICGLSDGAAWPVKNAIKKFRKDFEDYIQQNMKT